MKKTRLFKLGGALWLVLAFATNSGRAVILFGSGDPAYNATPPTGALQDSGWQYEGQWGGFLGTPIAPQYFVAAQHIGGAVGQTFVFNGVSYTTTACWNDPDTDLRIWKVDGVFPIYAPLYATNDEAGKSMVDIGRGTQRGAPVEVAETQTVYTTNEVDLAALGITKKAAKAEFSEAAFAETMTVVTTTYATNVVDLSALGITKKAAQAEFPKAKFQGSIMTVLTPVYTTNEVDLSALGLSKKAAKAEFPKARFQEVMTVVTSDLVTNSVLKGWQDGPADGVMRWGQNQVCAAGSLLLAAFTGTNGPDEAYLSGGDSSGAVFIQNNGVWQLAGINYGIDGPFADDSDGATFYGAIFDEDDLYVGGVLMPNDGVARHAYYYATRISPRLAWIQSIISQ